MKQKWWILTSCGVICILLLLLLWITRSGDMDRDYRIGFENDPPFHFPDKDGKPAGLVVDILSEAARRVGIRLQWVYTPLSSETALVSGRVDLWPLITIRPERRAILHITEPYRENETCLVVRAESPIQKIGDLRGATIAYAGQPLHQRMLQGMVSDLKFITVPTAVQMLEAVCRKEADAAFLDEVPLFSAFLNGLQCGGQKLRLVHVEAARGQLGIGSTFQAAAVADSLRDQISAMAMEGLIFNLNSRWIFFSGRSMELNSTLMEAKRKQTYLLAGIIGTVFLLLITTGMTFHIRNQKNKVLQAEEARRVSEERYAALFNNMNEGVALHRLIFDENGRPINYIILDMNRRFEKMLSIQREEALHQPAEKVFGTEGPPLLAEFAEPVVSGKPAFLEIYSQRHGRHFRISVAPIGSGHFATILNDVTDRKRAEEERIQLIEQLQQSQKMESVGRLAGGVAHDFNNLLTIINGYLELLLSDPSLSDTHRRQLSQVQDAGQQAANLTQQLLAFSRRQVIQPKTVNLNRLIQETEEMIRRLIGEDIEFVLHLDTDLPLIKADPGQMHQVLINLVANARDAMPKGGTLRLQTKYVVLDADDCVAHAEATPGPHAVLSVSDTGVGIEAADLPRIFEPFFSTKEKDKGTGLGLSMVYGIIKQNQGWIQTCSELGKGATFEIYLPKAPEEEECVESEAKPASSSMASGKETILLVEDQPSVRSLAVTVLSGCGYRILEAAEGQDALRIADDFPGKIDLLLTDVVLPGMTGKELADRLIVRRPETKVLFVSGYTDDIIAYHGVLQDGVAYLAKPYTPRIISDKVREILDQSAG